MIEIPAWVLWGLLTVPFGIGAAVTGWAMRFVLTRDCCKRREQLRAEIDKRFGEEMEQRKAVWIKIDRIYDLMATGVIKVSKT